MNRFGKLIFHKLKSPTFMRRYHQNIIDHYENPRNIGSLNKYDKNIGTGLVGAPACGDVMKMQIQVDRENGEDSGE